MKVLIFGATGMVGAGVLLECLEDPRVESILLVSRGLSGVTNPKVTEVVHDDFFDFRPIQSRFADRDACFFCLGVSSAGMSEGEYTHLTYDLTTAAACAIAEVHRNLTFCYVSGAGTDSTEKGRSMWARVKGRTENALLAMGFKAAFLLRPAYIQPLKGVRSKTALYQAVYTTIGWMYPVLRRAFPGLVTTTVNVGRAMILLAAQGFARPIVDTRDINRLASES